MKDAASLSGALLAKKGGAIPARGMEPTDHLGGGNRNTAPANRSQNGEAGATEKRPVGSGERIAMTLRLDHEQHLKLRLYAAHSRLSSQEIMMEALENYIESHAPKSFQIACKSLGS